MKLEYTQADLRFKHYRFSVDNRNNPEAHDLDLEVLDLMQGYEVLIFANTFLNLFLPDHSVADLHNLEGVFLSMLPRNITTKRDIAAWLARHIYYIRFRSVPSMYHFV